VVARSADDDRPARQPALRVIRGDATPEEIAALVAILLSRSPDDAGAARRPDRLARSAWSDRSRQLRGPLFPGPSAWRRSALPG
jgi:Acyl-CoA carboxylase epsilon subunit